MQQQSSDSQSDLNPNELVPLARRWGVGAATILRWRKTGSKQYTLLAIGMKAREERRGSYVRPEPFNKPIENLSLFAQQHGVFIKDVVRLSGLTRQTLNRLARKKRTACRLRDLIAGTEAVLAAVVKDTAGQPNGGKPV